MSSSPTPVKQQSIRFFSAPDEIFEPVQHDAELRGRGSNWTCARGVSDKETHESVCMCRKRSCFSQQCSQNRLPTADPHSGVLQEVVMAWQLFSATINSPHSLSLQTKTGVMCILTDFIPDIVAIVLVLNKNTLPHC